MEETAGRLGNVEFEANGLLATLSNTTQETYARKRDLAVTADRTLASLGDVLSGVAATYISTKSSPTHQISLQIVAF